MYMILLGLGKGLKHTISPLYQYVSTFDKQAVPCGAPGGIRTPDPFVRSEVL
jgi:hypothetical protein